MYLFIRTQTNNVSCFFVKERNETENMIRKSLPAVGALGLRIEMYSISANISNGRKMFHKKLIARNSKLQGFFSRVSIA